MNSETHFTSLGQAKTCQNCKKDFTIEPDDFAFYEKIKVPAPTFCSECRLARRLVWRNERSLYKRTCDLCKKSIIAMYPATASFPVYCHECWWSDKWDPLSYGREYDFSKPFFEQFKALQMAVPKPFAYSTDNVGSEYCNYTAHQKDCYLMFGSWFNENCSYGQTNLESKECFDCMFIASCEQCYSSVDITKCNLTHFSQNCLACFNSAFLYDCANCQDCLFCFNLRNKSYHIYNKQVSKEEFEKIKKETFSSYSALQKAMDEFRNFVKDHGLHKFMAGVHNKDVSGDYINSSKNVFLSYYINGGENEKYAVRGGKGQKDAMDVFGVHAGELAYDCNNIDFSSRIRFSVNGENNINCDYLADCDHLTNCFGCISARKKEYCILNKQYDEITYLELREKIIKQMSDMPYIGAKGKKYSYGEMFPFEISPHSYNETLAQDYIPVSKEQASERGYSWLEAEDKNYNITKSWKDLSDSTAEIPETISSDIILCEAWDKNKELAKEHKCSMAFKITPNELAVYKKWGMPLPRKCPNTRNYELSLTRNRVGFYKRQCQCSGKKSGNGFYLNTATHLHNDNHCQNEFITSYAPDRSEIVYCEHCYQQEVA